ncbi:MAG TPA: Hpt domain-containing protein [Bryobacteraceae bacterium]|jgi:HPt (histidine-containing phosphotransfer) domain-containing protein|nr:Hpt domain-containing protein [Bryobacteraceae bacterium]
MTNVLEPNVSQAIYPKTENPWLLCGALLEFAEDGEFALVRQIVSVFLNDTRLKMALLQQTVRSGDVSEARRIAHSLKGAARQVGTLHMAEAAAQLENCVREIDQPAFSRLVLSTVLAWEEASRSIAAALASMPR